MQHLGLSSIVQIKRWIRVAYVRNDVHMVIQKRLRRGWEEVEKRLRRGWKEVEKRLRRGWKEVEKRLKRGWEELRGEKRWGWVEKRVEKIWDITATYCNSFSKTLIGPLIAVHCPRFGRLVVQGKLRDPQPRWCPMAMRRIRMYLDQNPKGIRWGSFPKVCWGRTWGRTVELCRNHPTKNITKRFVHVIHVFKSRAKKRVHTELGSKLSTVEPWLWTHVRVDLTHDCSNFSHRNGPRTTKQRWG